MGSRRTSYGGGLGPHPGNHRTLLGVRHLSLLRRGCELPTTSGTRGSLQDHRHRGPRRQHRTLPGVDSLPHLLRLRAVQVRNVAKTGRWSPHRLTLPVNRLSVRSDY